MRLSDVALLSPGKFLRSASPTRAYWRFEEGDPAIVFDSSGNNNTGSLLNGAGYDPATLHCLPSTRALFIVHPPGAAIQGVVIPDAPSTQPSAGLTLEAWVKPLRGARVIVGKQIEVGGTHNSYQLELNGDQGLVVFQLSKCAKDGKSPPTFVAFSTECFPLGSGPPSGDTPGCGWGSGPAWWRAGG